MPAHTGTMRAAVYHGRGDVRIDTVPVPIAVEGQALVKVLRSGICGTDATEYKAGPIMFPIDAPHPKSGHQGPLIIGHEFVGEIVDLPGGPVEGLSVGDHVASGAGSRAASASARRHANTRRWPRLRSSRRRSG